MNKQKILILTIGILTVSILGGFYLINKPNSNELNNEVEKSTLKQTVEDNFTSTMVTKSEQFGTVEEMEEYVYTINTITSEEEGISFIEDFLINSSFNQPELVIGYYKNILRDSIIELELLPVYDDSGYFDFDVSEIDIKCTSKDDFNSYEASYILTMIDKETGENFYQFNRKDKFELEKEMENIYITDYERNTVNSKELYK